MLLFPLRTRERINLFSRELRDSDLAALLGALSLNTCAAPPERAHRLSRARPDRPTLATPLPQSASAHQPTHSPPLVGCAASCLKELNISSNPAPVGNGLRAAMVQALPWHLLRNQPAIRITSL